MRAYQSSSITESEGKAAKCAWPSAVVPGLYLHFYCALKTSSSPLKLPSPCSYRQDILFYRAWQIGGVTCRPIPRRHPHLRPPHLPFPPGLGSSAVIHGRRFPLTFVLIFAVFLSEHSASPATMFMHRMCPYYRRRITGDWISGSVWLSQRRGHQPFLPREVSSL